MSGTSKDSLTQNALAASRSTQGARSRALWGLFDRKERWSLSWRGRLILISALLLVGALVFRGVYPFLATNHRIDTDVLVVEGWIHEYAIRAAADEFRSGAYRRVFTTGGPVEGTGGYINDYQTSASVGADLLRKAGVPDESLQMVPSRMMDHDRTYGSAVALRKWFHEHNRPVPGINVVTEDLHARRTRLLFQKALGHDVAVGIISVPNPDYDARHWWRYSEGVKDVIAEAVAYSYARFLFYPPQTSNPWSMNSKTVLTQAVVFLQQGAQLRNKVANGGERTGKPDGYPLDSWPLRRGVEIRVRPMQGGGIIGLSTRNI